MGETLLEGLGVLPGGAEVQRRLAHRRWDRSAGGRAEVGAAALGRCVREPPGCARSEGARQRAVIQPGAR